MAQPPHLDIKRYALCGIPITALAPKQAALAVVDAAKKGGPFEVHLCNAYTLSLVDQDAELREGFELEVLKAAFNSATTLMKSSASVLCVELYSGQPLAGEVISFLQTVKLSPRRSIGHKSLIAGNSAAGRFPVSPQERLV